MPFDCEPHVCTDSPEDGAFFSLPLGDSLIQLPPVIVQHPRCDETCADDVLHAIRLYLPDVDAGCVTVEAPDGITWSLADGTEQDAPIACPADRLGCELAAFDESSNYIVIAVTEPADFARNVVVRAYDEDLCVGVPAADCSSVGCNGAGG
jgi:hypothetical protein